MVLARDPSGRHLLAGNVAAMITATVLYVVFVLVLTGAVGARTLAGYAGTALTPLAAKIGPVVGVLGTVYITLGVGLSALYLGLGLFNQSAELIQAAIGEQAAARLARVRVLEFSLRAAPLAGLFVVVAVLLAHGSISFTEPLNLIGTLTLPLLAGIFPMLLVAAARQRGERLPGRFLGPLGHPIVILAIEAAFLLSIISFGLWIWTDPLERGAALAVSAAMIGLVVVSWQQGAFRPRTVVEYRVEAGPPDRGVLSIMSAGRPMMAIVDLRETTGDRHLEAAEVVINAPNRLRSIEVSLPNGRTAELEVWIHLVVTDGSSEPIPGNVEVGDDPGRLTISFGAAQAWM